MKTTKTTAAGLLFSLLLTVVPFAVVAQTPVITSQPQSQTVAVGANISFSVGVSGVLPPASSGSLRLWLKADAGVITNSNGQVSQWQDQSSNLNHANQSNTNVQPLLVYPGGLNGQPALRFDGDPTVGLGDYLQGNGNVGLSNAYTSFMVYLLRSPANVKQVPAIVGIGTASGNSRGYFIYNQEMRFGAYNYDYGNGFIVPTNTYRIATHRLNTNETLFEQFDATATTNSGFSVSLPLTLVVPPAGYTVGSLPSQAMNFAGDIAELIYYKGQLSEADRQAVQQYLKEKYFVAGTGGPYAYQWFFNGSSLPGATSATLPITNVQFTNAGSYSVVVSNSFGPTTSSDAVLGVVAGFAPSITTQPQSQTGYQGGTASFTVAASGTGPLYYQWFFNGGALANGTNSAFAIANLQNADSGSYSVIVSNSFGSATSSTAGLTVSTLASVFFENFEPGIHSNLWSGFGGLVIATNYGGYVSSNNSCWFGGDGSRFATTVGLNTLSGGTISFYWRIANGGAFPWELADLPGEGIVFESSTNSGSNWTTIGTYNTIVYSNWTNVQLTIPLAAQSPATLFRWRQLSNSGATFDHWALDDIQILASPVVPMITAQPISQSIVAGSNAALTVQAVGGPPFSYQWQMNGTNVAGATGSNLTLSNAQAASEGTYDVVVCNSVGCTTSSNATITVGMLPSISQQPISQAVNSGQTVLFAVVADGSAPLSYQWRHDGVNVPGATTSSLSITNIQQSGSGSYAVIVTNPYGSVTSSNAVLSVTVSTLIIPNVSGSGSSTIQMPISLLSLGTENALGFSLAFDPTLLSVSSVSLGSNASAAMIFANTNQQSSGRAGIVVSFVSGDTFAAGTNEVAVITFTVGVVATNTVTAITFGNTPTLRQVSDTSANVLPATYVNGSAWLSQTLFEGDVSPRPNGDQGVTIADWVQIGRFVAGLDAPSGDTEFQRADCSPRTSLGSGRLTVSDWVQAGRYAAGLDPLTPVGGPSTQSGNALIQPRVPTSRTLSLQTSATTGPTNIVSVQLNSQGDENAIGFSLSFDSQMVQFTGAALGSGASGASMNVNSAQATNGTIGVALELPFGQSFASGTQEVVRLSFVPIVYSPGSSNLTFTDAPVIREVSDATANALSTGFVNNSLATTGLLPVLAITQDGAGNVTMSWTAAANGYGLESVSDLSTNWSPVSATVVTNGANVFVTQPAATNQMYFRLRHP